ncbi:MAG: zinc ribbon domain-containing protein [Promethearchaeota archaeon]
MVSKNKIQLIFITLIVLTPIICSTILCKFSFEVNSKNQKTRKKNQIILTQEGNSSIDIEANFPKLIWIEGQLIIKITSNLTGYIKCIFTDSQEGEFFTSALEKKKLYGQGITQTFRIISKPFITTFPGQYKFNLLIYYINSDEKNADEIEVYNEDFDIILGMGYFTLFSFIIIFSTALIMILTKREEIEEIKPASGILGGGQISPGKIKCPKCQKLIDEGLTFCPECGERIPSFLQFNSESTSGLL